MPSKTLNSCWHYWIRKHGLFNLTLRSSSAQAGLFLSLMPRDTFYIGQRGRSKNLLLLRPSEPNISSAAKIYFFHHNYATLLQIIQQLIIFYKPEKIITPRSKDNNVAGKKENAKKYQKYSAHDRNNIKNTGEFLKIAGSRPYTCRDK